MLGWSDGRDAAADVAAGGHIGSMRMSRVNCGSPSSMINHSVKCHLKHFERKLICQSSRQNLICLTVCIDRI